MTHSLIPIVLGYVFAHYLTYLVERGQETIIRLADPLDRGWNVLWLSQAEVSYALTMHPGVLATSRSGSWWPVTWRASSRHTTEPWRCSRKRHQLTGQLAMMLVMVG